MERLRSNWVAYWPMFVLPVSVAVFDGKHVVSSILDMTLGQAFSAIGGAVFVLIVTLGIWGFTFQKKWSEQLMLVTAWITLYWPAAISNTTLGSIKVASCRPAQ